MLSMLMFSSATTVVILLMTFGTFLWMMVIRALPVRGTLTRPEIDLQRGATAGVSDFIRRIQALKLVDFGTDSDGEPALLIHDLSPKETLRELRYIFDGLFKQKR